MKKLFLLSFAITMALSAAAWSQKGHDVTAYIAEQHLTDAARCAVDSILDGKSMVYWSNWLDNASHTPEYKYTSTWHYKNVNKEVKYEDAATHPLGNVETAISKQIEILADTATTKEQAALALKILIHLMGDMHAPLHLGRQTDLGGNKIKVKYFGRDTNLHSMWDGQLVDTAHKWSYTEWQQQIDRATPEQADSILDGTLADWVRETYVVAQTVYAGSPEGQNFSYDYVATWTPVIEEQFLKGGLRLAAILNSIYQ